MPCNPARFIQATTAILLIISLFSFVTLHENGRIGFSKKMVAVGDSLKTINTATVSPHPLLSSQLYTLALQGYHKLDESKRISKPLLTIVDFSKPSNEKRMFIIDMSKQKMLVYTWVAHGKNSGEKMATSFSNQMSSLQSSLGFYITGSTYNGGNGYSMKLKGLEPGFNDKAEERAVVMHGASYVDENFIKNTGRLGRSWGCPAVSMKEHKMIIDLIKQGSCLFIYAPEKGYLTKSRVLNELVHQM